MRDACALTKLDFKSENRTCSYKQLGAETDGNRLPFIINT